jgi:hypothetical protein
MAFRPLLCIRIDEETDLRIYEERHAQEVAELVDQNRAYLRQWLPWVDNVMLLISSEFCMRYNAVIGGSFLEFNQGHRYVYK